MDILMDMQNTFNENTQLVSIAWVLEHYSRLG